jgi:acylphosphatase
MEKRTLKYIVSGRVQGVGFRWFTLNSAQMIGIKGYVKNRANGTVEIVARGTDEQLERFLMDIKKGPSFSRVDEIKTEVLPDEHLYHRFEITY